MALENSAASLAMRHDSQLYSGNSPTSRTQSTLLEEQDYDFFHILTKKNNQCFGEKLRENSQLSETVSSYTVTMQP
ncbi:hypothetical protein E2C01_036334 [Portunus trituberculatus]|uniref:Uncharacterized protein n=1 Tax=Portunus trituberculatus TaxID=210409 RepID=A0A5B7FAX2_PORTR|nr:hypothetical protein [Portunus trituberculatus]